MSYSQVAGMSEQMKQFQMFQQFLKMQETAKVAEAPAFIPIDERMKTAYQASIREKASYQEVINAKKEYFKPFDAETFVPKMFHKTHLSKETENSVGRGLMTILRTLVQDDPSRLNVIGGIHNNDEGTKTYLSACVKINDYSFYNLHFYGALRNNFFALKKISIFLYDEEVVCECVPPPPPQTKGIQIADE
jgi:hypothetical protein